jgi:hypothetical protein
VADTDTNTNSTWQQKLGSALQAAVTLKVVTYVGPVTLSVDPEGAHVEVPKAAPSEDAMFTAINLAQGDIVNIVPKRFWTPEEIAIREFHQQQVGEAKDIVDRNIRLLIEAGKALGQLVSGKP